VFLDITVGHSGFVGPVVPSNSSQSDEGLYGTPLAASGRKTGRIAKRKSRQSYQLKFVAYSLENPTNAEKGAESVFSNLACPHKPCAERKIRSVEKKP